MKKILIALTILMLPLTARAADGLTEAQKKDVQEIIKSYLVENPSVVIDALEAYQRDRDKIESQKFTDKLGSYRKDIYEPSDTEAGNKDGDVTIVEFFDYNCGYCKRAVDDIIGILAQDKNVRIIFKDIPILGPSSQEAARWALAAAVQGKYYDYHVALMKSGVSGGASAYEKIGKDLGLDVAKLRKDATESKAIRERIEKDLAMSQELGISGTPAFIIGDQMFPGYIGLDAMKQAVSAARGKKSE